MKDCQTHLETLRKQAAETALIRDLATDPQKQELFAKLTVHSNTLAAEVERAMVGIAGTIRASGAQLQPD
jgi:ABC-type branched-subunit amino acid transport system ATPase component